MYALALFKQRMRPLTGHYAHELAPSTAFVDLPVAVSIPVTAAVAFSFSRLYSTATRRQRLFALLRTGGVRVGGRREKKERQGRVGARGAEQAEGARHAWSKLGLFRALGSSSHLPTAKIQHVLDLCTTSCSTAGSSRRRPRPTPLKRQLDGHSSPLKQALGSTSFAEQQE